jgi:TolB-like protein/Flp pilus assembly protein TadD
MPGEPTESGEQQAPAGPPPVADPIDVSLDAFISYASHDAYVANSIAQALEKNGFRCWVAPRDVTPGSHYADQIMSAISRAKVLVLVLSESALASKHVGKEVERASSKGRPIIALRTDATPLTPAFEYFLSESQWIDVGARAVASVAAKLVEAVRSHAGSPVSTSPVAAAPGHSGALRLRRWVIAAVAVLLAVAFGYFVVDKIWKSEHAVSQPPVAASTPASTPTVPPISERSIAVLPFIDLSEKHDQEYFADGMAEEVLDLLANIPGLKVISRTSAFQFKGKNQDLRAIASALGVSYVVEGSVRRSGERLRVTAQLISAQDGSHLWSDTYDESVGDTLKVQDQIASHLARALQVTVGADYQLWRPTFKSPEAHDLYLRGRHALDRADQEGIESAAAYFQQVLDLDPTSVYALQGLAKTQIENAEFSYVEPNKGFEEARRFAQRAFSLDPKSSAAYVILSRVHLVYDWDWAAAERDATEAMRLSPRNPDAIGTLGAVYVTLGRWDDAAKLAKTALTLDPLSAIGYTQLGNVQLATGRLTEAGAAVQKALQISPTFAGGHYDLGLVLLLQGNFQGALAEMQQERLDSARDVGLAMAYYALGRRAESGVALAQLVREHAQDLAWQIADVYAYCGKADQAFAWLDRAYNQRDSGLYLIKVDPFFKTLKGDSRYKAFLRKMKLPE